jgi:hypothetical protein
MRRWAAPSRLVIRQVNTPPCCDLSLAAQRPIARNPSGETHGAAETAPASARPRPQRRQSVLATATRNPGARRSPEEGGQVVLLAVQGAVRIPASGRRTHPRVRAERTRTNTNRAARSRPQPGTASHTGVAQRPNSHPATSSPCSAGAGGPLPCAPTARGTHLGRGAGLRGVARILLLCNALRRHSEAGKRGRRLSHGIQNEGSGNAGAARMPGLSPGPRCRPAGQAAGSPARQCGPPVQRPVGAGASCADILPRLSATPQWVHAPPSFPTNGAVQVSRRSAGTLESAARTFPAVLRAAKAQFPRSIESL